MSAFVKSMAFQLVSIFNDHDKSFVCFLSQSLSPFLELDSALFSPLPFLLTYLTIAPGDTDVQTTAF